MRLSVPAALFFLSGFAALLYQVIWQRILGIFSGVHIYSITVIVTAFMAGLGCGSLIGGSWTRRLTRRQAVLAFAGCEILIGLFAFASPWVYYDVAVIRLTFLTHHPLVLPFAHFALLLFPTFLMGASLPLLSKGLVADTDGAARTVAVLYGVNTLGAGAGALTTVWFLVGTLGFTGSIHLGSLLNLAAGVGAFLIARRIDDPPAEAAAPEAPLAAPPARGSGIGTWALIYGFSGFVALSLEILWFRILDTMIKSSPYTFGHLLGVFLLFLGAGSLAGTALVGRVRRPDLFFLWGQWAISLAAALSLLFLCLMPEDWAPLPYLSRYWIREAGFQVFQIIEALGGGHARGEPVLPIAASLFIALPAFVLGVPTFLMGMTFSLLQKAVQTEIREVGWRVGLVQTANIAGSMLGSLLTGALLLGAIGTSRTVILLLLLGSFFGALAARRSGWVSPFAPVALSALLALAFPPPHAFWARFHGGTTSDVLIAEDPSGVASITYDQDGAVMRVNGLGHSHLPFDAAHTLIGALPSLFRPETREVLMVGLGMGGTAWATGCMPSVERVHVYEIAESEHTVLRMLHQQRPVPAVGHLFADPRMLLQFTDGRLALRREERQYDLIEADAAEPYQAFSGNLYSREFFQLVQRRLSPGGILCTYVPTARTRRTVVSVFPHVLDFHAARAPSFIIASDAPLAFDAEALRARLHSAGVQRYFDESKANPEVTTLIADYLDRAVVNTIEGGRREREDVNTDLFPRDEFSRARMGDYR